MTSAQSAARSGRAPSWDELVGIGLATLARPRQILWAIVAGVILAVVQRYVPGESGLAVVLFPLVIVAYFWIELVLSRQFLTEYLTIEGSDFGAILRLVGITVLAIVALTVLLTPLVYMFSLSSKSTTTVFYVVGVLMAMFLRTRLAFYVPALSVGDDTSLRRAFDQSKPYFATILAALLVRSSSPQRYAISTRVRCGRGQAARTRPVLASTLRLDNGERFAHGQHLKPLPGQKRRELFPFRFNVSAIRPPRREYPPVQRVSLLQ